MAKTGGSQENDHFGEGFASDQDPDQDEQTREKYENYRGAKDEDGPLHQKPIIFLFRLTALFLLLSFATFTLGSFLKVFTLPPLDFLADSRKLSKEPWVQELQPAVVGIRVKLQGKTGMDGGERSGTGFNIGNEGLIVTNQHLVEDAAFVSITFAGLGTYQAKSWFPYPDVDLAVIELGLEGCNFPHVEMEEKAGPLEGEQVIIIGNPLGFPGVVMQGEVTGFRYIGETMEPLLEIKAPIHPGSSGSPVFNEEGRVVAVVFASISGEDDDDRRGLAIPVSYLSGFFDGY